ncbi:tyrosine-protein kinase Etk/Wzc [Paraburkholderia sp. BL6665CI2N2]|uniref:polysaccharide biosynthesis tyrosine autokinase n=1 Tax=Paraburkholderia sp. BL6665CI2N2 TaxID=1938806 RepID=UPI0010660637|nr:polysaccharide biosynthesis tyrosine autokinase [Paraburkholderia sp. BL6665CI2N2]TDY20652.1 tyrosine-protein kinase Etk/Wzc [Paraburkholderia sp. BL6665CI2N2]
MNSSKSNSQNFRESDEIDVRGIVDMIVKNVRLIVVVTGVFCVLGTLYAIIAAPVYGVDVVVQVESSGADMMGGAEGGLVGGLSTLFDVKSTDDGEMEILQSRLVTESVVKDKRLFIDAHPRYFPLIGSVIARHNKKLSTPGVLGIGGFVWGRESITVSSFDVPRDFWEDRFVITTLPDGRYRLSGDDIDNDATGQVGVPLRVQTASGNVNLVVDHIEGRPNAQFIVRRFSTQKMLTQLQKDLVVTEKGKDQSGVIGVKYESIDPVLGAGVINEIADNYVRQNADRKAATAEKSLQFLTAQLPQVEGQLRVVEDRLNGYQNKHQIVDLSEQANAMLGQAVSAQTALFELEQKRKALGSVLTTEHPQLASLDQQIAAARLNISSFESAISRLPDAQQNVVRLRRDVTVQTAIYVGLLNSIQQLRLATASKIGNVRVIDHAVVPDEPVRPKVALVVVLATIIGLLVGICVAIARAVLHGAVTDPSEIERDTDLEVIATIPRSPAQKKLAVVGAAQTRSILSLSRPHEPAVEALRSLCTAMQFLLLDKPKNNLVLITGPSSDIGKSFTSANVATLLGQLNKRVLLIDGDLRRGHLAKEFGVRSQNGLANVLRGEIQVKDAIVRDVSAHVDFLPAGPRVGQPVELFQSNNLSSLLSDVSHQYDLVLIDAPPLLPVTDATVFAAFAGTILLVARSGVTSLGEIRESAKRIGRVGAKVSGVVFNCFSPGLRSAQYGNYGAYAYEGADAAKRLKHE